MVEWLKNNGLVDYDFASNFMENRVSEIVANKKKELIWLVEHPPYTPEVRRQAKKTY
jgi:lipoyl(octanoyl) transferase